MIFVSSNSERVQKFHRLIFPEMKKEGEKKKKKKKKKKKPRGPTKNNNENTLPDFFKIIEKEAPRYH